MLSKEQLEKIANPAQADIGGTQSPIITQMAIELLESRAESLSLREQLAELKALEQLGYIDPSTLADEGCSGGTWMKRQPREAGPYTMPIFIAAKPAEDKC